MQIQCPLIALKASNYTNCTKDDFNPFQYENDPEITEDIRIQLKELRNEFKKINNDQHKQKKPRYRMGLENQHKFAIFDMNWIQLAAIPWELQKTHKVNVNIAR